MRMRTRSRPAGPQRRQPARYLVASRSSTATLAGMTAITILMYHQVGHFPAVKLHRASYCNVERFEQQMRYLNRIGATVMSMSDALRALRGEIAAPPRAVVLTFDDGYQSFAEHALPVLQRHGYPAIVYVLAARAGQRADWYAVDGQATPPLMTWADVQALPAQGIEIGSHGLLHTKLAGASAATLRAELADSRKIIEDQLGRAVPHFCYPFGSVDVAAVDAAAEAGYSTAVTCQRGAARPDLDPLALPRLSVRQNHGPLSFAWRFHTKRALKGAVLRRGG
jgi:peptidoglycan/xylan/chitin deacetylase (PgdA/CDA1 family)